MCGTRAMLHEDAVCFVCSCAAVPPRGCSSNILVFVLLERRLLYRGRVWSTGSPLRVLFVTPSNAHPYEEVHRRIRNLGRRYSSSFSAPKSDGDQRQRDGRWEQGETIDLLCLLIFRTVLWAPLLRAVVAFVAFVLSCAASSTVYSTVYRVQLVLVEGLHCWSSSCCQLRVVQRGRAGPSGLQYSHERDVTRLY